MHLVELTDRRYLRLRDEEIGNQTAVLLDAVRSVGAQPIDVNCSVTGEGVSSASTTT